jgi:hypothetical protein
MRWNDISSSRIQKFRDRKNYHAIRLQSRKKKNKQNENQTNKQTKEKTSLDVVEEWRRSKEKATKRFYGSMSVTSASESKLLATVEPATPPPTTTIRFLSAISSRTGTCKWRENDPQSLNVCLNMCAYICLSVCSSECLRMLRKKQQKQAHSKPSSKLLYTQSTSANNNNPY